jgi:phage gpG-like protein
MRQFLLSFYNRAGVSKSVAVRVSPKLPGEASRIFGLQMRAARQRIHEVIGRELVAITRSNFGPAGAMRPAPWPAYSPRYGRKHPGPPTLIKSGVLMQSVAFSATNKYAIVSAEGARDYAAAQQFGYRPGRLPARPYFPVVARGASYEVFAPAQRQIEAAVDREVQKIFGSGGGPTTSGLPSGGSAGGGSGGGSIQPPAAPTGKMKYTSVAKNRAGRARPKFSSIFKK